MDSRWWENYFVRYLVGSVVGALLVLFLLSSEKLAYRDELATLLLMKDDLKGDPFLGAGLAGALGFAFCYIASAPILTIHALRAHFRVAVLRQSSWLHPVVLVLVIGVASWLAKAWANLPTEVVAIFGLIFGVQAAAIILCVLSRFQHVGDFYRQLAERRSALVHEGERPTLGEEYITSYRHLREHGNAFTILLMEGALAYLLFYAPSAVCAALLLTIWVAPAAFAWIVGTVLESKLVRGAV